MKDPAKLAKLTKAAMTNGFFVALEQARIEGTVGPALFGHEYRRYFDMLLNSVREAQKETEHIRLAVSRMQAAASAGSNRSTVVRLGAYPDDQQFQASLRVFQGWVASLFETYLSLFSLIEGINGATRKVDELAAASKALLARRLARGFMDTRGVDLFKSMTEM